MSFKPMLAYSKTPDPESLTYPVLVQPKFDGIRAVVKDGQLISRTLKPIPNKEVCEVLSPFEGLDGELIMGDPTADDCYRATYSYVMTPEKKTGGDWTFYVFDKHDSEEIVEQRIDAVSQITHPRITVVPTYIAHREEELERLEAQFLTEGYEGGIIRIPGSAYKYGRSGKKGPLLKLKRYIDYEAEVISVLEELHNANEARTNALGRTERSSHAENKTGKGTLGALNVRALNGPHKDSEFKVGTGFSADLRKSLWHEDLVGKIAKIKSFPVGTKDRPRHPVWLGWRDMEVDG